MRKSVENLATSKLTGGRRHPLRIRRKYEIDRYPNEALTEAQQTVTRKVRGKNSKTALKTIDFVKPNHILLHQAHLLKMHHLF